MKNRNTQIRIIVNNLRHEYLANAPSFCPDKIIFVPNKIKFVLDKIFFVPDKIFFGPDKKFCPRLKSSNLLRKSKENDFLAMEKFFLWLISHFLSFSIGKYVLFVQDKNSFCLGQKYFVQDKNAIVWTE